MDEDALPAVTGRDGGDRGLAAASVVDDGDARYSSGLAK
jgi:hypothetical protein